MPNYHLILNYLDFLIRSKNEHSLHSPFVFELYTQILRKDEKSEAFHAIEQVRKKYLIDDKCITINEMGAGSHTLKSKKRFVKDIAKTALKPPHLARFLYRLARFSKPQNVIELGTSLGITTSYLAISNKNAKIFTLEGNEAILNLAKENFKILTLNNIETICGDFKDTLPQLLKQMNTVDFVYFDGNHQYAPTMDYFKQCLEKVNENSVFVFDDIYWSKEMKKAWNEIVASSKVSVSIDVFHFGICFFKTSQPKQHFVLRV